MSGKVNFRDELRSHGVLVVGLSGPIGSGKSTMCETIDKEFAHDVPVFYRNFADALKEQISAHLNIPLDYFYTREGKAHVIESTGHTVGRTLQLWGTALRDCVSPDIWIIALRSWIECTVLPHCAPRDSHWTHDVTPVLKRRDDAAPLLEACDEAENSENSAHDDDKVTGTFPKSFVHHCGYYRPQAIVIIGDLRLPNEFLWLRDVCGGMIVKIDGDPAGVRLAEQKAGIRDTKHVSETALDNEEMFCPDSHIFTDDLDRSSAAASLVDSLTTFTIKLASRDRFFDFYNRKLFPLIDAVIQFRRERHGEPIDVRKSAHLLFDNAFGDEDHDSLFGSHLVEKAVQWNDLQKYVVWLGARAELALLDRYIANWHSIFNYQTPYTRFLQYASEN